MDPDQTVLKVTGYTFRRSNSAILVFTSLFNGVDLLEKEFTLIGDPILEGLNHTGKQTGSHKNCLPLENGGKTCMEVYGYTLKEAFY